MAQSVKVVITNRQKDVKIPSGIRLLIRRCCHAVLATEGFEGPAEVSVSFVNNEQIRELNNEFRHKDAATDVLSFPLGENGVYDINEETGAYQLGDVVISVPKAMEQAEQYGHSLQREMGFLTVHSMLHLLGYDHEAGGLEALRMREKEETVMSKLGLARDQSYTMQ
ncbi:rRNA maturation RNase YbeY [Merdimmobilis hominis]|jgi:probable rRNA maturation factor|uniref:Endoribonuclease YbeY n=1 Tax=uncultured Anaerotruncus sp. TaxID=905011 RepID=A0A6N2RBR3_9FIRM|nr:rRNA maturation RNase YbeY [Merdimmobilis hominis]MCD4836647.1 rRNA maturation RNase YbeY [Merdimmobilis hominis]PWL57780.1 MAG: rRNA maturation RNase YbeY [Oscillospiraceae bacterium]